MARISLGLSGRTGVRHRSSNSRIVRLSMTPAAWRPSAVSWIEAIRRLRYCLLIAHERLVLEYPHLPSPRNASAQPSTSITPSAIDQESEPAASVAWAPTTPGVHHAENAGWADSTILQSGQLTRTAGCAHPPVKNRPSPLFVGSG